jgi:hypothetical protein
MPTANAIERGDRTSAYHRRVKEIILDNKNLEVSKIFPLKNWRKL